MRTGGYPDPRLAGPIGTGWDDFRLGLPPPRIGRRFLLRHFDPGSALSRSCGTAISDTQCESVPEACSRVASSRLALFGAVIEEIRFAPDSPLEGSGFELSVPP